MAKDSEIELKLAIQPGDAAAFRRLSLLREKCLAGPTRREVFNVYFDTPGLALKHRAMALRLRKLGGRWLQTLKTAGAATGGLHQRREWEYPLSAPQLDLALFRQTPLATLVQSKALHLALKPAFTTEFQRTTWLLEVSPGQRVEVALDQGVIRCGERETVISEVEIELLEGSAAAVFDLALALVGQIGLTPEILSKAERGYRLFRPEALAPRRAGTFELKRRWSPKQAMLVIIAACLDHFGANVEGALDSDDPEYIHQLRVALRRLRSAIRIFRPARAVHIVAELKWLTTVLGNARDWDVLTTRTLPSLLEDYGDHGLTKELLAAAQQNQADSRGVARAALASQRETFLVMAIGRWVGVPAELAVLPLRAKADGGALQPLAIQGLCQLASRELRRHRRHLLRGKRALADLSPKARHRVRVDVKRLRYTGDFFSSLFSRNRAARYLKVVGEIQDVLGETNDDQIAMQLLESLAPPERLFDFAGSWLAARLQKKLANVHHQFAELKTIEAFWVD